MIDGITCTVQATVLLGEIDLANDEGVAQCGDVCREPASKWDVFHFLRVTQCYHDFARHDNAHGDLGGQADFGGAALNELEHASQVAIEELSEQRFGH